MNRLFQFKTNYFNYHNIIVKNHDLLIILQFEQGWQE